MLEFSKSEKDYPRVWGSESTGVAEFREFLVCQKPIVCVMESSKGVYTKGAQLGKGAQATVYKAVRVLALSSLTTRGVSGLHTFDGTRAVNMAF